MGGMNEASLKSLGIGSVNAGAGGGGKSRQTKGKPLAVKSPIDGRLLASVTTAEPGDVDAVIDSADKAFQTWRSVPAPKRGEFVRRIGERLRARKKELGELVSWEVGKITAEAEG